MRLRAAQEAELLKVIQAAGLDPLAFTRTDIPNAYGGAGVKEYKFDPLPGSFFDFYYVDVSGWWVAYEPAPSTPRHDDQVAVWSNAVAHFEQWVGVCKEDIETPDLWAALERERDALARPSAAAEEDTPFSPDEVEEIRREVDRLKEYVAALDVPAKELQEVNAKLDYLVAAAERAPGRFDWWNQALGALFSLAITGATQPHVVQNLISMTAHSLGHLFGGGPLPLAPGEFTPPA